MRLSFDRRIRSAVTRIEVHQENCAGRHHEPLSSVRPAQRRHGVLVPRGARGSNGVLRAFSGYTGAALDCVRLLQWDN